MDNCLHKFAFQNNFHTTKDYHKSCSDKPHSKTRFLMGNCILNSKDCNSVETTMDNSIDKSYLARDKAMNLVFLFFLNGLKLNALSLGSF